MKKLLLFLVLFPLGAVGQVFYQFNQPFPNAVVRVCPVPSGGNPCPSPSSIFQDSGFTLPITQPVTLGPDGNFGFWTSAGQYTIQIGPPYNLVYIISIGGSGGGGGSGTVGTGVTGQVATYPSNGTSVAGENQVTLAQGGLGVSAASIAAHRYFGNNTGAAAGGAFVQPACGDLSNAGGGCSMSTTAGGDIAGTLPSVNVVGTHLTVPLPISQGGTGTASLTAHGVVIAEGSASFTALTPLADSIPLWQSATVDPTVTSIPNCADSGGNHLNYNTTTHLFSCGNTSISGSINSSAQFSVAYYSGTGLNTQISGAAAGTSPNGVPEFITETPSGGVATAPAFSLAGVPVNAQTGTTYTVAATDRATIITANNAAASTYTATNPTTAGFGSNFPYIIKNIGAGAVTEGATGFTINGGTSLLIPQNWTAFHWSDNTNYIASRLPDYAAFPNCLGASSAIQFTSATGVFSCATISGTGITIQTNGVNNTSQTSLNLQNSAATNGLTLTATNVSAGNVQLGLSGTLNNAGLTNSSVTVNTQTCTLGSSCTVSGATNTQTASYTLTAADIGRLVVMNCSAACTVTLFGSPTNGYYGGIESIGSTVPTISLNTKNFNGSASVPVLGNFYPLYFWSDGANYFGQSPLVAGSNITFTPTSNGFTIAETNTSTTVNGHTCTLGSTCSLVFSDVAPTPTRAGDIIYWNGTSWVTLVGNNSGTTFLSESALGVPSWAAGSSTVGLNSITAAAGANSINNGDNAQVWNWDLTTASKSAFTFGENIASTATGTPILFNINTLAASTAFPLQVTARGTANGIQVNNATGSLSAIGTADITATKASPAGTSGNLMQWGTSGAFADSGIAVANVVTAASNYTSGDLVQAAGANKTTSDSGKSVQSLPIDVIAKGADPTGAADSLAAMTSAMQAACATSPSGATVYFPPGTYKFSGSWPTTTGAGGAWCNGLNIIGAGPRSTILNFTAGTTSLITVPSQTNGIRDASIQGFQINLPAASALNGIALAPGSASGNGVFNFTLKDIYILGGAGSGIGVTTCTSGGTGCAANGTFFNFTNVRSEGFSATGGYGFELQLGSTGDQFYCRFCYANQDYNGFHTNGWFITYITDSAADNTTHEGFWFAPNNSTVGTNTVIGNGLSAESNTGNAYFFNGGGTVILTNPKTQSHNGASSSMFPFEFSSFTGDATLVYPVTISTGGSSVASLDVSGTSPHSVNVIGAAQFLDKGFDSAANTYLNQLQGNIASNGNGSFGVVPLGTPATPTVTCAGACVGGTWGYKVVAFDAVGNPTAASAQGTATNATTLTTTNKNTITWASVPGAITYSVYRTSSAGTPANLSLLCSGETIGNALSCVDDGSVNTATVTPSVTNLTNELQLFGTTSGNTAIVPAAAASGTLTLPATTGTFVTAASNYTNGDLVQAAGANTTTSDSGIATGNVVTAASNAGAANQVAVSGGANKTLSFIDFPEVLIIPSANCNNTTAGAGWSIGSGGTVTCRAGTNNQGGFVSITDTAATFAQFSLVIPEDWDTSTNPYIRVQVASTDVTSGHTIIPQIKVSCSKGDGSTTDDVTFNAAHSLSTITLNTTANQFWSGSNVQMNSTDMTGCVAGALMVVQVGRATDTATNAEFYSATVTIPRKIVVQAN